MKKMIYLDNAATRGCGGDASVFQRILRKCIYSV